MIAQNGFGNIHCDGDCKNCKYPFTFGNCENEKKEKADGKVISKKEKRIKYIGYENKQGNDTELHIGDRVEVLLYNDKTGILYLTETRRFGGVVEHINFKDYPDITELTIQLRDEDGNLSTISVGMDLYSYSTIIIKKKEKERVYSVPITEKTLDIFRNNINNILVFQSINDYNTYIKNYKEDNMSMESMNKDMKEQDSTEMPGGMTGGMGGFSGMPGGMGGFSGMSGGMGGFARDGGFGRIDDCRANEPSHRCGFGCEDCEDCEDCEEDETFTADQLGIAFVVGVGVTLGTIGLYKVAKLLKRR